MSASRYVAPKQLGTLQDAQRSFQKIQEQLDTLGAPNARGVLVTFSTTLKAGEFVRISPRQGGTLVAKLPKCNQDNAGKRIEISLERPNGTLRISAEKPDTVGGSFAATFTTAGLILLQSNGVDQWCIVNALPVESPGGSISVPIPDQRVLGNDSGAEAVATPITVHQELDWIGGGSVRWVFDGVDDRVDLGNLASLTPTATTPFTAAAWITTTATAPACCIFGKQLNTGNVTGWAILMLAGGQVFLSLRSDNAHKVELQSTAVINDGSRHHVVFCHNGSGTVAGVTCYIDGSLVAMSTVADTLAGFSTATAISAQIGERDTSVPFTGQIEHVSWWSDDLTAAEVSEVYNAGVPPNLLTVSAASDLLDWWKLDATDVVGASGILDYGPGLHNGTAAGGLAPTAAGGTGNIPVRGAMVWQLIPPAASGLPLVSQGLAAVPAYAILDMTATGSNKLR